MSKKEIHLIEFWDHSSGRTPLRCQLVGEKVEESDLSVTLRQWTTFDEQGNPDPHNEECFAILKSTIISSKSSLIKE